MSFPDELAYGNRSAIVHGPVLWRGISARIRGLRFLGVITQPVLLFGSDRTVQSDSPLRRIGDCMKPFWKSRQQAGLPLPPPVPGVSGRPKWIGAARAVLRKRKSGHDISRMRQGMVLGLGDHEGEVGQRGQTQKLESGMVHCD